MKCKTCKKDFYNPYVKSEYCSETCRKNDKVIIEWDKFMKEFLWWFNK